MDKKMTLVLGASTNVERYSNMAIQRLQASGHPVIAVGLRSGSIGPAEILTDIPMDAQVDTLTLYVGPVHQPVWADRIIALAPKRIIFNPGTENDELEKRARNAGIAVVEGCTLVMLSAGTY